MIRASLFALRTSIELFAQSTSATLTGSVADPTGAAVPGAALEARDVNTGYVHRAVSNEQGQYTISDLRNGTYTLRGPMASRNRWSSRLC
jgi:protocatechuate 3,4-dioxygenase beta subunit